MNMSTPEQLQRQQAMALFQQQIPQGTEESRTQPGSTPAFFPLDASSAAKQMAALNATSLHRRASQSGGTSDSLFGPRHPHLEATPDAGNTSAQSNRGSVATAQGLKSRREEFLKFVAGLMNARQTPLPSSITGIPSAYDPATSPWKSIEPTADPGGFRLASKDVDLFKLWQLVLSQGGHAKLTRESGWSTLLSHFGLPEVFPDPQAHGNSSVARTLAQYYVALLAPFEEVYLRNMQQQQQKAIHARQQQQQQQQGAVSFPGQNALDPASIGLSSHQPQTSTQASSRIPTSSMPPHPKPDIFQQASTGGFTQDQHSADQPHVSDALATNQVSPSNPPTTQTQTAAPIASDISQAVVDGDPRNGNGGVSPSTLFQGDSAGSDVDVKKRKLQEEDLSKRVVRQRSDTGQQPGLSKPQGSTSTDSQSQVAGPSRSTPSRPSTANPPSARQSRMRKKIEYVPLAREIDTYGGRDLDMIDAESAKVNSRRPQRSVDDWGTVDIDGLTMSLRSRLPTELSYAITILSVLSTMRGQTLDTGFSLQQCDELLDELLDLLSEQAFAGAEDVYCDGETFWIHRDLVDLVRDHESQKFSGRPHTNTHAALSNGPKPSPADLVFAILNLFRNFSLTGENQRFMSQHPEVLSLILRICSLSPPSSDVVNGTLPSPASPALTLSEVVRVRRDVLTIVSNLAPYTALVSHSPSTCMRLFELLASFLVEPHDLSSPSGIVVQSGAMNASTVRPPVTIDLALEAFTKLAHPDANRQALSRGIKFNWLWSLFCSLVHRLPVSSDDFAITMRMHDTWLSYLEKVVLSIYSICFLAPPELKSKMKADRTLGFPKLILRMVKRFVSINHPDARQYFLVSSRRAVEALKLVDEGNDAFESPQSSGPMFAFGMGFGESDVKQLETGVGLLAAFQDDVTWSIMMMPHLDEVMFAELDSLSRISS